MVHYPGTHWAYHSANVNLLAGVLRQSTGLHADGVAEQYLFGPLGVTDYDWSFMAEAGYRLIDGSLYLRPRNMAKLGMLLSTDGRWQGRDLVPVVTGGNEDNGKHFSILEVLARYL